MNVHTNEQQKKVCAPQLHELGILKVERRFTANRLEHCSRVRDPGTSQLKSIADELYTHAV